MKFKRLAYQHLINWKNSKNHKSLLVRGARQVGKTTLIREFSKEFSAYLELNLEKQADRDLFEMDDVSKIINAILLQKDGDLIEGHTLLFIDEIQESPKAIHLLRYFYEERPDIFVVAAGSLLEFALKKVPNFPVGRIEYLYLHPLNFQEFLLGRGSEKSYDALNTIPFSSYAHKTLLNLFHEYAIVGGMPEILSTYIEDRNISSLSISYKAIWQAYKDDVEKYGQNSTIKSVIRHVISSAPYEEDRIRFEKFGGSNYRSREVGAALRSLDMAKIIQLIYPTTNLKPHMLVDMKKRPRLQFLDTGMLNQILMLQGEIIKLSDLHDLHRGKIIQHLVAQELISIFNLESYKPAFWVREKKDSNSEVDMLYHSGKFLIPIEVKSGKQGRLRSLHQFVERTNHHYAVRLYAGEFNIEEAITPGGKSYFLMNLPYFLATKIPEYIKYFMENYPMK